MTLFISVPIFTHVPSKRVWITGWWFVIVTFGSSITEYVEYLFGIFGMVIATPVVALLKIIYVFFDEKYNFFGYRDKEEKEEE